MILAVFKYEGGDGGGGGVSICNENLFTTPSTNALYAKRKIKASLLQWCMKQYFIIQKKKISYRLFKKHTNIHCLYFPPNCKDSF